MPVQQPPEDPTSLVAAVLVLLSRSKPYAFGPAAGGFTLYATHELVLALAACVAAPAAVAVGRVVAKWIEKLEPP